MVSPHVRGARGLGRPARAAALRRGRLGSDRVRQRQGTRHAPRRVRPVLLRHHRRARRTGKNELVVRVWDPTDAGAQPRGKQVSKPGGIWYTPVTGIWQTVWLEPVSEHMSVSRAIVTTRTSTRARSKSRVDDRGRAERRPCGSTVEIIGPASRPCTTGQGQRYRVQGRRSREALVAGRSPHLYRRRDLL